MTDYKKTLNLPSGNFPMKADLSTKEPRILSWWGENKIYQKRLEKNKNYPKYILHDGPPYANGAIHIGHAMNKILKDIIVRYRNMSYYSAPFVPGWDTHGLPIEHAVMKKDPGKWASLSPLQQREMCRQYAEQQIEIQREQFKKLGMLSDFIKCYYTFDLDFEIEQLRCFVTMVKKGLIYFAEKPVYWSWSSQSALAQAEVEYGEEDSPSIYVKFKVVNSDINADIIVWTTTPWTLPSNRAVAVNPNATYVVISYENRRYLLGKAVVESVCDTLGWKNYKIVQEIKGERLGGIQYQHPLYDMTCPIICDDYVSMSDGTGLVHNAPGFGIEDYLACRKNNIPIFCPIDAQGKFTSLINDEQLVGKFYEDTNLLIALRLVKKGLLLRQMTIKHKVAHDWRTHKPVIFRATKQWFVNLENVKQNLLTNFDKIGFLKEKNREQLLLMLTNRQEWCISRQRIWGVPIPIIFDADDQPIMDLDLINHVIEKMREYGTNAWFEKPVEFFLPPKYHDLKGAYKCHDIFDVWFDSGVTFNVFIKNDHVYPADLYLEGADQFRGWFNSSYINGCIVKSAPPYKAIVATGLTVDENGNKMSKSIGNVIDPQEIGSKYGYDILRLWVANAEYTNDVRVSQAIIGQNVEIYRRIRNSLFKFIIGNLNDFDPQDLVDVHKLSFSEKVMLNVVADDLAKIDQHYQKYDFYAVIKLINKCVIDYSGWYFEMIKDSLYCDQPKSGQRLGIQTVLYYMITNYLIRLAPILPFTCEEAFGCLKINNKPESVHLLNWNDFAIPKTQCEHIKVMEFFTKLREDVNQAIEAKRNQDKIGKINNLLLSIADKSFPEWINENLLRDWFSVAKVNLVKDQPARKVEVMVTDYTKCDRCWKFFDKTAILETSDGHVCVRCHEIVH